MENVSLKVLEKSLNFLFKNGYEPCLLYSGTCSKDSTFQFHITVRHQTCKLAGKWGKHCLDML